MKIENEILNILENCTVNGNLLTLPPGQLERNIYAKVNECLESIGGKWNRKLKGHLFNDNPADLLDSLLISGETTDVKKEYQYFPTPPEIAKRLIDLAEIKTGDFLLEPSAGTGHIADLLPKENRLQVVELMPQNIGVLVGKGYKVHIGDFLAVKHVHPDKIIMNPPFSKQQDIDHIRHAWSILNNGGTLVSIVSESPFYRTNKKSKDFLEWLEKNNAENINLHSGDFKTSGTMVKTRIIKMRKS